MARLYDTQAWKDFRRAILRQRPRCQVQGCAKRSGHVDHIVRVRDGGAELDPANVQALCHGHHSEKTAKADRGFGNPAGPPPDLRAHGCDVNGLPLDPKHHWRKTP